MTPSEVRILNLEPAGYSPKARDLLRTLGTVIDGPLARAQLTQAIQQVDVLIVRLAHAIDREIITAGTRLRVIVSATTGLDHIDLETADAHGVRVLSLKGENHFLETIPATAEHTWALLLALRRRIIAAHGSVLAGEWDRDRFRGHEVQGTSLGLVGLGRVGRQVARYAQAFGMNVHAYDPYVSRWMNGVTRVQTLPDLLNVAQILSIHVPLDSTTHGLVDARVLAMLPSGAMLINTSRGEILNEDALIVALSTGRLAGAALDTVCHERADPDRAQSSILAYARRHDNLLLTPHIGGGTFESMEKTEIFMANKLARIINDSPFR